MKFINVLLTLTTLHMLCESAWSMESPLASASLRGSANEGRQLRKSKKRKGKTKDGKKKLKKGKGKSKDTGTYYDECPMDLPTGDYDCEENLTCSFGEETCCGETHPSQQCFCSDEGRFICAYTDACFRPSCEEDEEPELITECPSPDEGPPSGDYTCQSGLICGFGEESCCGQTFPSRSCTCDEDGQFRCRSTDTCMPRPGLCDSLGNGEPPTEPSSCPAEQPEMTIITPGGPPEDFVPCTSDPNEPICFYDDSNCCGETIPDAVSCECNDAGFWVCLSQCQNMVCDQPEEPPSCPVNAPDPLRPAPCFMNSEPNVPVCFYDDPCCDEPNETAKSCACDEFGLWQCESQCSCDDEVVPVPVDCPDAAPIQDEPSDCSVEGLRCGYNPVECCGETINTIDCLCSDESFICAVALIVCGPCD